MPDATKATLILDERRREHESGEVAEYELVGALESEVGNGRVSVGAPVGRALFGTRRGDSVRVETPRGTRTLEVLGVRAAAGDGSAAA